MVIPELHLGPLNVYVASIKDSGLVPLGASDLRTYVLGCLSAQWVINLVQPRTHLLVPSATPIEGKGELWFPSELSTHEGGGIFFTCMKVFSFLTH